MIDFDKKLEELVALAIAEDVGNGDHSTLGTIPADATGKAQLKIKEDGVLAGVAVAEKIFRQLEPDASLEIFKQDGDNMKYGDVAFIVSARVHTILKGDECDAEDVRNCRTDKNIYRSTKRVPHAHSGYAKNNTEFSVAGKRSCQDRRRNQS
jgi:nicotinate-nucleotide pyrophosphorylase (carboxylating)